MSPTARLVACALTFWACDRATAEMSNRSLALYLGVSIPTVERAVRELVALGYIRARRVRPTTANMTGRIVDLLWVTDPSILPAPPSRSAGPTVSKTIERGPIAGDGTPAEGPSPTMDPARRPRGEGAIAPDGPGPSGAMAKEHRLVKKAEKLKSGRDDSVQRRRPQAEAEAEAGVSHLTQAIDRAVLDARQVAALTPPAIPLDPVTAISAVPPGLSDGQRTALAAMDTKQRQAFEAKSPGLRTSILAPFIGGFEPLIFERITRSQLSIPRFVAEARPVERSTAGLVKAVAGGDPRFVAELAESICRDLGGEGDRRRWGAIYKLAEQVFHRQVEPAAVLDAHRQALGPKADNPGAVFTTALRRNGWRPGSETQNRNRGGTC